MMTLLERHRLPGVGHGRNWLGMVLIVLATAVVAAAAVAIWQSAVDIEAEPSASPVTDVAEPESIFTSEELTLMELANRGYIPREAVDWQTIELKKMVAKGQVPAQALLPYRAPIEPLFSEQELATIEMAESGEIPMQSVDWEIVELKRLANLGQIPRQAVD